MTDRELLEFAAKAAGIKIAEITSDGTIWHEIPSEICRDTMQIVIFDPLTDDGDALRLAIKLEMIVEGFPLDGGADVICTLRGFGKDVFERDAGGDFMKATRRAIVRAAAEIGKVQR